MTFNPNGLFITGKVTSIKPQRINDHSNFKITMISYPDNSLKTPIEVVFTHKDGGDENNRRLHYLLSNGRLPVGTVITCQGHLSSMRGPHRQHEYCMLNMKGVNIQHYDVAAE
jgi:hypothetical protein